MCSVFRRERTGPAAGPDVQVEYVPDERDWCVTVPCDGCGGYRMGLQVRRADQAELAHARAKAFLLRVHSRGGCLSCEARSWRERGAPETGDFHVWWDTDSREWMAWQRLSDVDGGISVPLGIRTFWAPQEVRAAARALWSSDRITLAVAHEADAIAPDSSATYYDADAGRWKLQVACFDCGGFTLALTSFGRGAVEAACDEALGCLDLVAREGCPNCRTRSERDAVRDDDEPCIWFDTQARDWVLWQPLDGCEGGVSLPLGIGRFDARRALVYRAAANLLFDSQLFLDEGL
jgi:hypothetical protein